MSAEALQAVIKKAITEPEFRQQLLKDADTALAEYKDLTDKERTGLKALTADVIEGIEDTVQSEKKGKWYQPGGFKELGAAVLSLVTVGLLIWALYRVFDFIGDPPVVFDVGETKQSFAPFDRAKDVLNVLFPLFSAVFSFWLGITVEGRRADSAETRAQSAEEESTKAKNQVAAVASEGQSGILAQAKERFPEFF